MGEGISKFIFCSLKLKSFVILNNDNWYALKYIIICLKKLNIFLIIIFSVH